MQSRAIGTLPNCEPRMEEFPVGCGLREALMMNNVPPGFITGQEKRDLIILETARVHHELPDQGA